MAFRHSAPSDTGGEPYTRHLYYPDAARSLPAANSAAWPTGFHLRTVGPHLCMDGVAQTRAVRPNSASTGQKRQISAISARSAVDDRNPRVTQIRSQPEKIEHFCGFPALYPLIVYQRLVPAVVRDHPNPPDGTRAARGGGRRTGALFRGARQRRRGGTASTGLASLSGEPSRGPRRSGPGVPDSRLGMLAQPFSDSASPSSGIGAHRILGISDSFAVNYFN